MTPNAPSQEPPWPEVPDRTSSEKALLPLNAEEILSYLPSHGIGLPLVILEEVSSTNTYLLDLPPEQSPHGMVAAAECQTAGKGRHGRRWLAPPRRNLSFSIVLRPKENRGGLITLAAACASALSLRTLLLPAGIKWPNDVVDSESGLKLGGILCEARQEADSSLRLVLGIGLNVNLVTAEFPDEIRHQATSLQILLGHPVDRNTLLASLLSSFGRVWAGLERDGGEELLREARPLCTSLGCTLRMEAHDRVIEGTAVDLDSGGRLVLRLSSGVHRVVEIGEIRKTLKVD